MGQPGRSGAGHGPAARIVQGAGSRPGLAGAAGNQQPRARVRLPAPPPAPGSRRQSPATGNSRCGQSSRIPPLLPRRRGGRASARLYQHRRRGPGRTGVRIRLLAQGAARRQTGAARPIGPHRGGCRIGQSRAAGQDAQGQSGPAAAIPCLSRTQASRGRTRCRFRIGGDPGSGHRRSAGDGEPAVLQPE